MIFQTHKLPHPYTITRIDKILIVMLAVMWAALSITATILMLVETHTIVESLCVGVLSFVPFVVLFYVIPNDMKKAFVEITDDKIIAVDYYFGFKQEKFLCIKDIETVEITSGYSMKVRGYRFAGYGFVGVTYMVFRGKKRKYLFKLTCSEETKAFFERYFEIEHT